MAFSRITHTYSGQTTFAINFTLGYLDQSHVTCRVNDEADGGGSPVFRPLTFVTEGTVSVGGDALVNGDTLVFERTTPKDELENDYQNGAIITEENLDDSYKQALMIAHEALDGRLAAFEQELDMNGLKILNVADGTAGTDGVNLQQVTDAIAAASGLSGSFPGTVVTFDPDNSLLTSTNVQAAVDELANDSDLLVYDPTSSNLTALTVQDALDQINVGEELANTWTALNEFQSGILINGGVGDVNTGLRFGDGDTGIYELSDDVLNFRIAGSDLWRMNATFLGSPANLRAQIRYDQTNSTTPNIIPNANDTDSGVGQNSLDQVSLIAGGVEALRVEEGNAGATGSHIFVPNLTVAPTTNPTGGVYLFSDGGEIYQRTSGGVVRPLTGRGALLASGTFTSATSVDIGDGLDLDVDFSAVTSETIYIKIRKLHPVNDAVDVGVQVRPSGGSFDTAGTDYRNNIIRSQTGSTSVAGSNISTSDQIQFAANLGNDTNEYFNGDLIVQHMADTDVQTTIRTWFDALTNNGSDLRHGIAVGYRDNPQEDDALRIALDSGNIETIYIEVWEY